MGRVGLPLPVLGRLAPVRSVPAAVRPALAWLGVFAGYVALAAWLPPFDDEIYYWCWAQHLQLSYFDHPPMTALMIRASTAVFGDSLVALRLPACAASVVVLAVLWHLTRPRRFLLFAAATPVFTLGAVLVTPDTPLLLFWSLYLGWLAVAHARLTPDDGTPGRVPGWLWVVGGVVLGCAGLGKYTAALLVPGGFASFALAGRGAVRRWLPGYLGHGVVAAAVATPVFVFNLHHDFVPLRFQWEHANAHAAGRGGLTTLGEFVGVQVALAGTLPLVLLPWAWWNVRRLGADPRTRAAVALYAVPLTFFLLKSTRGPLEGNWALGCYLGFWPVAAVWWDGFATTPFRRRFAGSGFVVPAVAVLVAAVHLAWPLPFVPAQVDRVSRQSVRLAAAAQAAAEVRDSGAGVPVYCATYQWTALLRYHGVDARQLDGASRPSNFTLRPDRITDGPDAFLFNEGPLPPDMAPGFGWPELVRNFPIEVRGVTTGYVQLYRYTAEPPCEHCGPAGPPE